MLQEPRSGSSYARPQEGSPYKKTMMADTTTDSQQFQMKGFTKACGVFSPDEAEDIRHNVERYFVEIVPTLKTPAVISIDDDTVEPSERRYVFFSRMDLYDAYFDKLRNDPRLVNLASELLGAEVEAQHVQFLDVVPGVCRPTPPHQDAPIFSIEPNHAVTFWIPLCEVDEQRACLYYVPGSHWQGYMAHADSGPRTLAEPDSFLEQGVAMPVAPGDVLAHHCYTVHYSAPNTSGKNRWALAIHYYPVGTVTLKPDQWIARRAS